MIAPLIGVCGAEAHESSMPPPDLVLNISRAVIEEAIEVLRIDELIFSANI